MKCCSFNFIEQNTVVMYIVYTRLQKNGKLLYSLCVCLVNINIYHGSYLQGHIALTIGSHLINNAHFSEYLNLGTLFGLAHSSAKTW